MKNSLKIKPGSDKPLLIVGQGLAGTVLCSYLLKNNFRFKVVDNNHYAAATHAAAGLINPVTGRGYVKSWMIEELLPEARSCYAGLSELLGIDLIHYPCIYRSIHLPAQINKWNASTSRDGYETYVEALKSQSPYSGLIKAPLKFGLIRQAMQVNISDMISQFRTYLESRQLLISEAFEHEAVKINEICVNYMDQDYSAIIFCEGWQALHNPWFNDLPFQPAKGEALVIEIDNLETADILRDEIFIAPLKEKICWSGGSYIWDFEDHLPTEQWKKEWLDKLQGLLNTPFKIIKHLAGIRPSVKGRRPLIGQHPVLDRLYIFNGMGTKGTSLAPFWARHFVEDHLMKGTPVDDAVNINRFNF